MDISVVLCTWNNSTRLKITLESFSKINVSNDLSWEIVLVNNNSNDNTPAVCDEFKELLPIKYVEEHRQGLSFARNAGLKNASGKLIIFTDDDVKPCKNWLNIYWEAYNLGKDDFYWGGPIESDFEVPPFDHELIDFAPCSVKGLNWGNEQRQLVDGEFFISANWACSSNNINRIGLFDVNLGLNPDIKFSLLGEESDMMKRLVEIGVLPMYLPKAKIKHFVPRDKISLKHISDRAEAHGRTLGRSINYKMRKTINGVPLFIIKKIISLWFKIQFKKVRRETYYKEYLKLRQNIGVVKEINSRKN